MAKTLHGKIKDVVNKKSGELQISVPDALHDVITLKNYSIEMVKITNNQISVYVMDSEQNDVISITVLETSDNIKRAFEQIYLYLTKN